MDAAALEEDLAMLATTTPHNSGSWDSANLARAGQGKTLWIGEYDLCILSSYYLSNSVLKCKCNPQKGGVLKIFDALLCQCFQELGSIDARLLIDQSVNSSRVILESSPFGSKLYDGIIRIMQLY